MDHLDDASGSVRRRSPPHRHPFTAAGAAALATAILAEASARGGELIAFIPNGHDAGDAFLRCVEASRGLQQTIIAIDGPAGYPARPGLQVILRPPARAPGPPWCIVWTSPGGGAAFSMARQTVPGSPAEYLGSVAFDAPTVASSREDARRLAIAWGAADPGPLRFPLPSATFESDINRRMAWELQAAAARTERQLHELQVVQVEMADAQAEVVERLVSVMLHRDPETADHLRRIGWYAQALAERMGHGIAYCLDLSFASMLHDIGKVAIPDAVLMESGELDSAAWDVMRQHPVLGARILAGSKSPLLQMAERIALCHHERWDGNGYPHGLSAGAIPVEAQITAVVDAFDVMTSSRRYKEPMPFDQALAELERNSGTQFGPDVVRSFLAHASELAP